MISKNMSEQEMLNSLQSVWESVRMNDSKATQRNILTMLDEMVYLVRYELRCEYDDYEPCAYLPIEHKANAKPFDF